jgi:DNA-binding beta-propeller fold protein YncE
MVNIFKIILVVGFLAASNVLVPAIAHAATPYNASDVLGQPDFTSNGSTPVDANHLNYSDGTALDSVEHYLFVSDDGNNRVLAYPLDSNNNLTSHTPTYVLGQPNFTSSTGTATQSGMNGNSGIAYDAANHYLFVADYFNNRTLVYNATNLATGMNATYVLGQPNFTSSTGTASQSGEGGPASVVYDAAGHLLYVADWNNNRTLVYDTTNLANGMNATYVLGQPNFTSSTGTATQSGEHDPGAVVYDTANHYLFVADYFNNRTLVYNTTNLATGMNATYVLGQPNFTSSTGTTTQSGEHGPDGVAYDPARSQLFIEDGSNSRVLIYNLSAGITNGMNASGVLGQPDFTSSTPATTQSGFNLPQGANDFYDTTNNRLYVSDSGNNRVMIFNFAKLAGSVPATAAVGTAYASQTLGSQTQGTASYSLTSGTLPPGLSLNSSTGIISGTPTTAGSYSFTVLLSDNNGVAGTFTDSKSYSITVGLAAAIAPKAPDTGFGAVTGNPLTALVFSAAIACMLILAARRLKPTRQ